MSQYFWGPSDTFDAPVDGLGCVLLQQGSGNVAGRMDGNDLHLCLFEGGGQGTRCVGPTCPRSCGVVEVSSGVELGLV